MSRIMEMMGGELRMFFWKIIGVRGFVGVLEGGLGGCCLGELSLYASTLSFELTKTIGRLSIWLLLGMPCRSSGQDTLDT